MADITIDQLTTQIFYQIPQIFMTTTEKRYGSDGNVKEKVRSTSQYAKKLSNDAKLAYGALYNRCLLSIHSYKEGKMDYVDDNGSVFLIYTVDDLMDLLDKSKPTVLKVKKELIALGLLREVKQGANKANRLYLQNVDATLQEYEYYEAVQIESGRDKGKTNYFHAKTLDHLGNLIFVFDEENTQMEDGGKKSLPPKNSVKSTENGGKKSLRPKNLPREVKNIDPSNIDYSKTDNNDDTIRYKEKFSSEPLSISEAFKMGEHSFLTEQIVTQLSSFGELSPILQDKIFQAKRFVEKEFDYQLVDRYPITSEKRRLHGELFVNDLEREIAKLRSKVSIGHNNGRPIQNIAGYFYRMLILFWKKCLWLELNYDFIDLASRQGSDESLLEFASPTPEVIDDELYLWVRA